MHKVLKDAIIKCRMHRVMRHNRDEWAAYCAGCPLGLDCTKFDDKVKKEVR